MRRGIGNIPKVPELNKRLLFTALMLAIFRLGIHVPTPGINSDALQALFAQAQGTLFSLLDVFSGGGLSRFSVFALGIMPYISASIISELLTVVIPQLAALKKEGEMGRKKINQYVRYGTVLLCIVQSGGMSIGLERMKGPAGELIVPDPGWSFRLMTIITLTTGTVFIMWLGEQITKRGVGNGISLIIFAGIIAAIPSAAINSFRLISAGEITVFISLIVLAVIVATVAGIIFMELGQRRIPIQYPKRVVGRKVYGGQSTHLPLKVNTAGVIPPIFASSLLMFPATIVQFMDNPYAKYIADILRPGQPLYLLLFVGCIIFFCFFYTAIIFNPVDVADNLKKYGGYIPGIRPGKHTSEYIDRVLSRITLGGALYVSAVCVLPTFMIQRFGVPFYFGGTGLLIVIGVALDLIQQIESHLITRHYEGFMKGRRFKGRR